MNKHTPTAARIGTQDLQTIARQGVERALAARKAALVELSPEQTQQVAGAATVFYGGSLVPGWWIYGQPAFKNLAASQITQGINQVTVPSTINTQFGF